MSRKFFNISSRLFELHRKNKDSGLTEKEAVEYASFKELTQELLLQEV